MHWRERAIEFYNHPVASVRLAVVFAFLGFALIAGTLAAWYANGLPVDDQSSMWYLPLSAAGCFLAAAFVNLVVVANRPTDRRPPEP
jgi:hypothetical protein